ncbi:solute carrier family 15 member 4 [Elysia marginata]|uniref:Solute carrier family 15 member 4 n=1 Tax=Elysia marginata TaxID=1093978 RepID=A0AAV4EJE1_9GAST|nr:solute carrier family 15 member 4 [Elysia marginata]
MQGLLTGLFLASSGVGNWVATAILSIVEAATTHGKLPCQLWKPSPNKAAIKQGNVSCLVWSVETAIKQDPWWNSEINDAKMENLMFLLAGLMLVNTLVFIVVAHFYTYQDPNSFQSGDSTSKEKEAGQHNHYKDIPTDVHWTRQDDKIHYAYGDDNDSDNYNREGYEDQNNSFAIEKEKDTTPLANSEY